MTDNDPEKNHGEDKNSKPAPPSTPEPEIYSSRKHHMNYVDVKGVVLRTGYADKTNWYLLCIKELLDNAIDFLWKKYSNEAGTAISVEITLTSDSFFHLKVRNTNNKNIHIPIFENLATTILNYEMQFGSKQNQHIISRGMLGDAMKQILAWPYVLIHTKDDGTAFTDIQCDKPLIIKSNKVERHVFLYVDKANQTIVADQIRTIQLPESSNTDTEIETTWPIIDEVRDSLTIRKIERFCRQYVLFTTDVSFNFKLVDNSMDRVDADGRLITDDGSTENKDFAELFAESLASPARKAAIIIEAPACHSISPKWKNISTVHSYTPEEFTAAITSVYDKQNTTIYDVLLNFIEGTQMKKTPDLEMTIADFLKYSDKIRGEKIKSFYDQLKDILDPPKELSLPYSHIKKQERKKALVDRITQLYPVDYLDIERAAYQIVNAEYDDESLRQVYDASGNYTWQKGKGLLQFPFVFEIIAIPLSWDTIDNALSHGKYIPSEFIGAINYSLSPRGNIFEGHYVWYNKNFESERASSAPGVLEELDFDFGPVANADIKLPSIIVANLISPRIDYHGNDKSRIDTAPFQKAIIEGSISIARKIQSHRAAGFRFVAKRKFVEAVKNPKGKFVTKDAIIKLIEARKKARGLA